MLIYKISENSNASVFAKICSCFGLFGTIQAKQLAMPISDFIEGGGTQNAPVRIPTRGSEDSLRKTLVLDLDETLVTSSCLQFAHADLKIKVNLSGGIEKYVWMKFRPGVTQFLNELSEIYEIIIFTASIQEYGNAVIDFLDCENVVDFRVFRQNCSLDECTGNLYKDLSLLNRNLSQIIIIDNQASQFKKQPENGIQISDFKIDEAKNDRALMDLLPFLRFLSSFQDVRPVSEYYKAYQECQMIKYIDINGMNCEFTRGAVNLYEEDRMETEMSESKMDSVDLEFMNDDNPDIENDAARENDENNCGRIVIDYKQPLANMPAAAAAAQRRALSQQMRQNLHQKHSVIEQNSNPEGKKQQITTTLPPGKKRNGSTKSLFDFSAFKSSIYNKIRTSDTAAGPASAIGAAVVDVPAITLTKESANKKSKPDEKGYVEIQESSVEQTQIQKNLIFDISASQNDQPDTFIQKPKTYTKPHSRRCASQQIKFTTVSLHDPHFHSPMAKDI